MMSYLKLIRPLNLLMMVFTLYMVRYFFLSPLHSDIDGYLMVEDSTFVLFSFSFILIAAAGYIINDYYDVEIDKVNKPSNVIIGNIVSRRSALIAYFILNIAGIISGLQACYQAGIPAFGIIFLFYVIGLWCYSFKLKSTFLIGNILIALLLAFGPLAAVYMEILAYITGPIFNNTVFKDNFVVLYVGGWAIASFAFISNLTREIIKDAEDMEGDRKSGCNTLPIVLGLRKTRIIAQSIILLMMVLLGVFQYFTWQWKWQISLYYILIFIQLPSLLVILKLRKATEPIKFHSISSWLKLVMFTGICYLAVFSFEVYECNAC